LLAFGGAIVTKVCLMVIVAIGIALSVIEWEVMLKTGGTTNILGGVGFIMIVGGLVGLLRRRKRLSQK
jgi:LPXTG-motif cell wall-anchored protein